MFNMGKNPRKEKQNPVGKAQQTVAAVKTVAVLETLLNPVERVRKFHYLQTFAGDVVKADIKKDNHVKQWKQCAGTVP